MVCAVGIGNAGLSLVQSNHMEHTRRASNEGWRMLAVVAVTAPTLWLFALFFDMGVVGRVVMALVVFIGSGFAVAYAVANLRSNRSFSCRLTDEEFSQSSPVAWSAESFRIKLSEVVLIEIHNSGGEGPSDEWYIHTKDGRFRIASNYGNPDRAFGEAIQKALPHVQTVRTDARR